MQCQNPNPDRILVYRARVDIVRVGSLCAGLEIGLKPGLADRSAQCCAGRRICYDALDPS